MRYPFLVLLLFFVFAARAQEIPKDTWQNILIWGKVKSNHPSENQKEIQLALIDSLDNWHWNYLDSSTTIKTTSDLYSIYANRMVNSEIPMHQYWDFYLDSTHTQFRILSDSLLKVFPKRPYKMRYTSEYRTLQTQVNLLKKGKSKLPLSLHNFGFALDLGIYRGKRYLRRGNIYNQMGENAKAIGLFWGGDFKGFPDPGHIQYFENSSQFLKRFPWVAFEFLPFKKHFEEIYQIGIEKGKEANLQDTQQLIETLKNLIPKADQISDKAISIPLNEKLRLWLIENKSPKTVFIYHLKEKWFFTQNGYLKYFYEIK